MLWFFIKKIFNCSKLRKMAQKILWPIRNLFSQIWAVEKKSLKDHIQNSSYLKIGRWDAKAIKCENVILWFLLFSFQYGDAAIHTAVRHDHVHLLPYLLGQSFQSVLLPTRNGSHKEVEHVNLQNEVSAIKAPLSIYFESTNLLFIPFT